MWTMLSIAVALGSPPVEDHRDGQMRLAVQLAAKLDVQFADSPCAADVVTFEAAARCAYVQALKVPAAALDAVRTVTSAAITERSKTASERSASPHPP